MLDRPVVDEFAWRPASLPVQVAASAQAAQERASMQRNRLQSKGCRSRRTVGLLVSGADATPTFNALAFGPYTRITRARAANFVSSI
jgi:hypothetical protein